MELPWVAFFNAEGHTVTEWEEYDPAGDQWIGFDIEDAVTVAGYRVSNPDESTEDFRFKNPVVVEPGQELKVPKLVRMEWLEPIAR